MNFAITLKFLLGLATLSVLVGVLWGIRTTIRRSKDPKAVRLKWIVSLAILGGLLVPVALTGPSEAAAVIVPLTCVVIGIVLSLMWTPHIVSVILYPLTSAIDGGTKEIEAKPLYSIATSKRRAGKYSEAIEAIHGQLEKYPEDHAGQMLLATIYAEDLKDLSRAEVIVQRVCNRPKALVNQIAGALNTLADWQITYAQDPELARQALEALIERLPETEYARAARQRIAHLASTEMILASHDRPPIKLTPGAQRIGLLANTDHLKPKEAIPAEKAKALLAHLAEFPDDNEARENLAQVYSEGYQRPEMAIQEFENLISRPHQPAKQVVQWLNRIADLQIKQQKNFTAAAATLQRLIELFPNAAASDNARSRLSLLKLEERGQQETTRLTIPEYDQRLGLKWAQRRDEERD